MIDIVIGDPRVLGIGHCLVLVLRLRVERDDIPSVQKAGNVTKHAEEDVDYGVCCADARFYPDYTTESDFAHVWQSSRCLTFVLKGAQAS